MSKNARLVVIEGTDGSGKQTQTKMLVDRLKAESKPIFTTSFPNYESSSAGPVKMYLQGEIAGDANDVSAKAASVFYATDRYITFQKDMKQYFQNPDYMIVLDRYSSSNIIHQGAKIIGQNEGSDCGNIEENLSTFISWLDNLEHVDFDIPRADITFYLHVPVDYSLKLMAGRNNKISGESKKDIHEADVSHLIKAEISGMMAAKMLGWKVIECVKDGIMRTREDIHDEIYNTCK